MCKRGCKKYDRWCPYCLFSSAGKDMFRRDSMKSRMINGKHIFDPAKTKNCSEPKSGGNSSE